MTRKAHGPLMAGLIIAILMAMACKSPVPLPPPGVYSLSYHGNGETSGEAPIDLNTYEAGSSVVIKGNIGNLDREGYYFAGWNAQEDGSAEESYQAGSLLTMPAGDYNLFALWQPLSGSISIAPPVNLEISITGPQSIAYGSSASFTAVIGNGTADLIYWQLDDQVLSSESGTQLNTPVSLSYGPHSLTLFARHGDSLFSASVNFIVE